MQYTSYRYATDQQLPENILQKTLNKNSTEGDITPAGICEVNQEFLWSLCHTMY